MRYYTISIDSGQCKIEPENCRDKQLTWKCLLPSKMCTIHLWRLIANVRPQFAVNSKNVNLNVSITFQWPTCNRRSNRNIESLAFLASLIVHSLVSSQKWVQQVIVIKHNNIIYYQSKVLSPPSTPPSAFSDNWHKKSLSINKVCVFEWGVHRRGPSFALFPSWPEDVASH